MHNEFMTQAIANALTTKSRLGFQAAFLFFVPPSLVLFAS
jgi:hypothetical protein